MAKKMILNFPVTYGGVSFGKKTARIGLTVSRDDLKIGVADKNLCDRRLELIIKASGNGDQEGQGRLEGMEDDLVLAGVADVKGFGVHAEHISFGLTFNVKALKTASAAGESRLDDFASREGRLQIVGVETIPEEEKHKNGDGEEEGNDDGNEE